MDGSLFARRHLRSGGAGAPRQVIRRDGAASERAGYEPALYRGIPAAKQVVCVPDAVQREAYQGVYARLRGLCGAVLRWSGTVPISECGTVPGQLRTTKRCCAAPGTRAKISGFSDKRKHNMAARIIALEE